MFSAAKEVVKRLIGRLRGVFAPTDVPDRLVPMSMIPVERVATLQPRERVIAVSYRKKKRQQKNWSKWKKG